MNNSQTTEPMILVKKPDGTSVRVPLSSLKKEPKISGDTDVSSATAPSQSPLPPVVVPEPVAVPPVVVEPQRTVSEVVVPPLLAESYPDDVPVEPVVERVVAQTPVVSLAVVPPVYPPHVSSSDVSVVTPIPAVTQPAPVAPQRRWSADDHSSPLVENIPMEHGAHDTTLIRGDQQIAAFLVAHPGMVAAELQGRAVSLLSSFVKGVRSRDQVLQYAMKPMLSGGLELNDQGAQALIQQIEAYFHMSATPHVSRQTRVTPVAAAPAPRPKPIEPPLYVPTLPQVSSATARPVMTDIVQVTSTAPSQVDIAPSGIGQSYPVTLTPQSVVRSPEHQTVGPVEEMQSFTKEDFRRLSSDPQNAADVLLQKIENISKESPLLGLAVCRAWFQSALYKEYIATLSRSFALGQTVDQMSSTLQLLSPVEMGALLKINRACEEV